MASYGGNKKDSGRPAGTGNKAEAKYNLVSYTVASFT